MKLWERVWHQPVSAARPYLLMRTFLVVLAFDAWTLMIPRGALYGSAGFNVAHFPIFDWLQPTPSSASYVAIVLVTGVLALVIAWSGFSRFAMAALFALYTYGWAMSLLDSFQHHYFLSLVLFCLVFFPKEPTRHGDSTGDRGWPTVDAWAYKLLGVSIAVTYVYAAVSKLDGTWRSGQTLRGIVGDADSIPPLSQFIVSSGVDEDSLWQIAALTVIALELLIAAGYVFAILADRRASRILRTSSLAMFMLAVALHTGIERVGMQIGWFSYYMMLLAGIYFLPLSWLEIMARLFVRGEQQVRRIACFCTAETANLGFTLIVLGANLAAFGFTIELPGAGVASLSIGVGVLVTSVGSLRESWKSVARLRIFAVVATVLVMWAAITLRPVRFEFYLLQGQDLHQRGRPELALLKFERAQRHAFGANASLRAQLYQHTGLAHFARERHDEAVTSFRRAVDLAPSAETSYNLARALGAKGQVDDAMAEYRHAISLDDGFAEAHHNLALLLADKHHLSRAEKHWRRAIRIRPDLAPPYNNLGNVYFQQATQARTPSDQQAAFAQAGLWYKRATGVDAYYIDPHLNLGLLASQRERLDEAERHFRAVLQLAADHQDALFHMGSICESRGDLDKASSWYRKAIRLYPEFAEAHYKLAGVLESKGNRAAAANSYEEALRIAPQLEDAKRALRRIREQTD